MLPEGVSPLDIRYNVINWVHRSTRGWSTGGSVIDPRTGEIIKGVVTLGSLRDRQDYLIAEGLLLPYKTGDETPPELREWAIARIRQLSAHEIGHTLGLGHNYYDSDAGRISVLDYPHPLVTLKADGTLDYSQVYDVGMGEWDKVAIAYGYQHFPEGTDEAKALAQILDAAWKKDLRYMTNQDTSANPRVDQWSNGTDPAAELTRMMAVRRASLSRFGEQAIKRGQPMALMEEVLVPLYLHHRYQIEAAASAVGGIHYIYAMRGDGREAVKPVPRAEQTGCARRADGGARPGGTGAALQRSASAAAPPVGVRSASRAVPAKHRVGLRCDYPGGRPRGSVASNLLAPDRAARLVEQRAIDPSLPGLGDVIDRLLRAAARPAGRPEVRGGNRQGRAARGGGRRDRSRRSRADATGARSGDAEAPSADARLVGSGAGRGRCWDRVAGRDERLSRGRDQAVPRSSVDARWAPGNPRSAARSADRRSRDGLASPARSGVLNRWDGVVSGRYRGSRTDARKDDPLASGVLKSSCPSSAATNSRSNAARANALSCGDTRSVCMTT